LFNVLVELSTDKSEIFEISPTLQTMTEYFSSSSEPVKSIRSFPCQSVEITRSSSVFNIEDTSDLSQRQISYVSAVLNENGKSEDESSYDDQDNSRMNTGRVKSVKERVKELDRAIDHAMNFDVPTITEKWNNGSLFSKWNR
jgi:hypothetical protein